jgi:ABC-2 type transport system permease protein
MSSLKAISILWLRQMKRYLRSKSRMAGSLGQPLLFLLALWFGIGPIYAKAGNGDYLFFLAPGIIAMSVLFMSMFSGTEVIWDKQFGFLKETLVAPVSRFTIMIGRTIGGATVAVMQGVIVFLITLLIGFRPQSWAMLPLAFLFLFLVSILFTAVGTAIGSVLDDMHAFPIIMNFIIMPIFFLSGALFPLEGLPSAVNFLIKLNPLTYGVDGIRGSLVGGSTFGLGLDFAVLAVVSAVMFAIGAYLFSKLEA